MTIGKKLMTANAVAALLTLAVAGSGYWGLQSVFGSTRQMLRVEAQVAERAAIVRTTVLGLRRYEKDILINIEDAKKVEEYVVKFHAERERLLKDLDAVKRRTVTGDDQQRVAQMAGDAAAYAAGLAGIIDKIKAGQVKTAADGNRLVNEHKEAIHRLEKNAAALAQAANERMAGMEALLAGQVQRTLWFMLPFAAVAVVAGFALSTIIRRGITGPLRAVVALLKVAEEEGDLTGRLEVVRRDELGQASESLNAFLDKLEKVMILANNAAGHVSSAAQQLAGAAEQLSSGAQEQASSLEETAASLEEITGTVKQNADNAKQASSLAMGSRDVAEKGGQVVTSAVGAMGEINRASKKIADIITTIDEIAFQTNLLALNAAVEAARAGEQGRGFAVVAAEVRNLAQRSATAAKEIKGLIADSVHKVEDGSELVNKSGATLTDIVASVKRVTDIIAEIAAASHEQTAGVDQVNRAVTRMDEVVQSNASQTEELSSTAQSLAGEAERLQALIARFKLNQGPARVAAHRALPPPAAARAVRAAGGHQSAPAGHPAPEMAGARTPERQPGEPHPRRSRKTDEPVMATAPAANGAQNGTTHHADDGFEEF